MFRFKAVLGVLCAASLSGCGARVTTAPDGVTTREFFVGSAPSIDCSEQAALSAQQVQMGVWLTGNNAGAGFQRVRYFCGAPQCQVTFWANGLNRADLEEIAAKYHGICIANNEGEN